LEGSEVTESDEAEDVMEENEYVENEEMIKEMERYLEEHGDGFIERLLVGDVDNPEIETEELTGLQKPSELELEHEELKPKTETIGAVPNIETEASRINEVVETAGIDSKLEFDAEVSDLFAEPELGIDARPKSEQDAETSEGY